MSNSLSNGVAITVSTDALESKIDAVTGKFIKTLSKSQKALGMSIDEMGRFINANGKLVEGLSQAQIKLGQYVDEEGKLHTANGGFVADLNKIEQALGFYADELGNVYNAQKEKIRITAEARKKLDEERVASEKAAKAAADAAEKEAKARIEAERKIQAEEEKSRRLENELREERQRSIQTFGAALGSFSQISGQFASLLALIECTDDEMSGFRSTLIQTAEAASVGIGVFQSTFLGLNSIAQALPGLKTGLLSIIQAASPASAGLIGVGTAATTASVGMKAFQLACGPAGIAIAALGAGLAAFAATGHKNVDANEKISDSLEEIRKRAGVAKDEIRGLNDVLKYGAFYKEKDNSLESLEAKLKKQNEDLAQLEAERDKAQESAMNVTASGPSAGTAQAAAWKEVDKWNAKVAEAQQARDEVEAQYNEIATGLIAKIREEQQTEEQKANALKKQLQTLLERTENEEDQAAIRAKIASIDQSLADAKAKELAEQEKRLADQRAALAKDLGISLDFAPVKSQVDAMADDLAKLSEAFHADPDMFGGVEGALEEAENRIRQKYSDQNLKTFSDALGKVDSTESLDALTKDLADKLEKNLISQDAYNAALDAATKKEAELTEARIAAIPGLRELLDESNINQERLSKAEKEHADTLEALAKAHEDRLISDERFAELVSKADEKLAKAKEDGAASFKSEADRQYAETMEALDKALQERLVTDEKYAELARKADERLAKAKEDEAAKLRADARSKLGIDAIMEELKLPAQKFADKMKEAQAALDANQINKEEFDAYRDKIQKEIYGERKELETFAKKFEEPKAAKPEKEAGPAKSMEAGSADLYLAQVKNSTAEYQRQIQTTTAQMAQSQLEALEENRMTNYYLAEMLDSGVNFDLPVWG